MSNFEGYLGQDYVDPRIELRYEDGVTHPDDGLKGI